MDYFITGSRAYGPYTEDSDLDVVVMAEDSAEIFDIVAMVGLNYEIAPKEDTNYADVVWYFWVGELKINVVTMKNVIDFNIWKEVTIQMAKSQPIKDKDKRVMDFKARFRLVHMNYPESLSFDHSPTLNPSPTLELNGEVPGA